jgi:hypothetical protein
MVKTKICLLVVACALGGSALAGPPSGWHIYTPPPPPPPVVAGAVGNAVNIHIGR